MKLRRDTNTGKIHDDDDRGRPVVLCGGTYHVFEKYNKSGRGLARPRQNAYFTIPYEGTEPCVDNPEEGTCSSPSLPPRHKARLLTWSPDNNWAQLFTALRNTNCNLLRVWVMGGTIIYPPRPGVDPNTDPPFDLYPFAPEKVRGVWKWKVYDAVAVENGVWNQPFFERLVDFVDAANANRVCVLLTLFNYYDFANDGNSPFKSWGRSPWNPALSINPADKPGWGDNHLVNAEPSTFPNRNTFFIKPTNRLRVVQTAYVRKFVQTLRGKGNVIFEIMNEPRFAPHKDMSRFNSDMVKAINDAAGTNSPPPLIAVNASFEQNGSFDTDWWREHSAQGAPGSVPGYERVDVLTYHGMTGFKNHDGVRGNAPRCRDRTFSVPPVDPSSMINRVKEHKAEQASRTEKKSLMFSTDAARIDSLEHLYCDADNPGQMLGMHVRDGQIETRYPHSNRDPAPQKALKSDLRNWAFWFSKRAAGANLGLVHFQNHSGFEAAFQKILTGREEAARPAPAGEMSDTLSEETSDTAS